MATEKVVIMGGCEMDDNQGKDMITEESSSFLIRHAKTPSLLQDGGFMHNLGIQLQLTINGTLIYASDRI